jgi:hypothetical protein
MVDRFDNSAMRAELHAELKAERLEEARASMARVLPVLGTKIKTRFCGFFILCRDL